MKNNNLKVLLNGLINENPVFVLVLGTCPTLAISAVASSAIGMGLAATFVLLGSNIAISLLKNVIPDKVRIPSYIVLIAGFVTIVELVLKAFQRPLYNALGIYLPLIVVNCIILGRAEMFANKNNVLSSALDAIGMGAGFTLALLTMGSIREIIGSGTWFGMQVLPKSIDPMAILKMAPGGFFVFGVLIALVGVLTKKKPPKMHCGACPLASNCGGCEGSGGKA